MNSLSSSSDHPAIILDLSRLLSRVLHPTPTGVDRCEMAYARGLLAKVPDHLLFSAVHPFGFYGRLSRNAVLRFLDETEHRWETQGFRSPRDRRHVALSTLISLLPKRALAAKRAVYVQASPNNLTNIELIRRVLKRERARFLCLVHDLIPLQYPEYARAGGAADHARRVDTIVSLSSGIIANSHATLGTLQSYIDQRERHILATVAHLGVERALHAEDSPSNQPYFVCIGTIEPRKNHLLLLHLWRVMSERAGSKPIPKLLIIGRRGWENEQVVDMLERCPALKTCVQEHNGLPDSEVKRLLSKARGLLLPSFAEGYGMPVTEAMALGVPVVCSDIPALREAGQNIPLYLDPLDGPAWEHAVIGLSQPHSDIAARQKDARRDWLSPSWHDHIATVLKMVHRLADD